MPISGIQQAVTVLGLYSKHTCSRDTNAPSALGVFTIMRYINPHSLNLPRRNPDDPNITVKLNHKPNRGGHGVRGGSFFLTGSTVRGKCAATGSISIMSPA